MSTPPAEITNIRQAAYDLCKVISKDPARTQVADLIRSFRNTQLGYYGHRQYAQTLGYLIVNQEREQFERRPFPEHIEALRTDQLKVLMGFQNRVSELNKRCVRPLTEALPNCTFRALDPYNHLNYSPPDEIEDIEILTTEQTEGLVSAFNQHPKIAKALESSSGVPPTFSEEYYMQNTWGLEEDVTKAGLEVPEQLQEMKFRAPKESANRRYLRHIAAVMSIRASLSVLNQLIYQKLFMDKLLVIDETNTIKSGPFYLGTGCSSVIFQHAGLLLLAEVGDIILLKRNVLGTPASKLCRVGLLDPYLPLLSPGEPRYAELREIDENLDPYGALFIDF